MKLALAALLLVTPVASAEEWKRELNDYRSQAGYSTERKCVRQEYREEYTPGTANSPGYVRSWHEQVEIPCSGVTRYRRSTIIERDSNDCSDGKIAGGLLGGAAGAALSQGDGRWWAIPLGVVTGATIGCDIDGG